MGGAKALGLRCIRLPYSC